MKGISKAAMILTKIMEVGHWVAVGLMGAVAVLSAAAPQFLKYVMDVESVKAEKELSVYGFEVVAANGSGEINYLTLLLFAVGAIAIFVLMALVFRNLNAIIKRSEKATPFSAENIASLKWIGRFCMIVPLVEFVMRGIINLAIGEDAAQIGMDQSGVIMGLVILCLTEYFARGAKLEQEVDGLL